MAKAKRQLIFATFIISCAATVLLIVSMATEEWITADLKAKIIQLDKAEVNYGLFSGVLVQYYLSTNRRSQIALACIFEENICGFSTKSTGSERINEIQEILNDKSCKNNKTLNYIHTPTTDEDIKDVSLETLDENVNHNQQNTEIENTHVEFHNFNENSFEIEFLDKSNKTDTMRYTKIKRSVKLSKDATDETTTTKEPEISMKVCDPSYLNGGLWLMTTFFLSLSIITSALTATLSVVNTAGNPISPWFNIWGLYIWNSLASFFILITLILWGSEYAAFITNNVAVVPTLDGQYGNSATFLGFSYWMLLAPFFLHISNVGMFYLRQYLIEREPEISEDKIDSAGRDGMIFVY